MPIESYTNSSLASARRCLREFDLRYGMQLDLDAEDRETLQVGQTWHKAFEYLGKGLPPYDAIAQHAPSPLWNEKLRRLFAAHEWYWKSQPLHIVEAERQFDVEIAGHRFRGQIDGIVEMLDGRRGVLERKTTGFDIDEGSSYWDKLRLDVQVGLYSHACGFDPDFIIYDVVRKPTISPKAISQKDAARLRAELDKSAKIVNGMVSALYYESFGPDVIEAGLAEGRETIEMYGARLTADIGERPAHYFARREVHRTKNDYDCLENDLLSQIEVIEHAQHTDSMHRNPDACNVFGLCAYFRLCSNNVRPTGSDVPDGFRRRDALHPELVV